tara:strand:+ start:166 stop:702 length:537 start_codon:yes stop_codon:yes gene_type:complete
MKKNVKWKYNADDDGVKAFYLPASVMRNSDLSCKAKVVWAYMNSRPSGWDFSSRRIAESMKEGYQSLQGAIRELVENGYLGCQKLRNGRVSYTLIKEGSLISEEEAEQSLKDTFPNYQCREEEFVCTSDAINELMAEGWSRKDAGVECLGWSSACSEGGIGQSRMSWVKWKGHMGLDR